MNNTRTGFSVAALAVAILLLFQMIPLASAQDQDYDQDPPTRAGRLGYVQGAVSFQPPVQVSVPLLAGPSVLTEPPFWVQTTGTG